MVIYLITDSTYDHYRSDAHPAQKLIPSRSRWLATLVLVAVVAAWFLISTPTPAEAEVWWSATLTTGTSTGSATSSIEGFSGAAGADYGSLSDDTITFALTDYTISRLGRDGASLIFDTDPAFLDTLNSLEVWLVVGPNNYRLKDATKVGSSYTWARTVDELEDLFIFEQNTEVALLSVPYHSGTDGLTAVAAAEPRQVTLDWIIYADVSVTKHQYRQKKGSEGYGAWIDIPSSFYPHGTNVNSYTVTNLYAVEYTFQIRAVNRIGASGTWNEASATPTAAVPGAPRNLGASPRDGSAQLTWEAPASNGGSAITGYQYQQKEGNGDYGDWQEMTSSDVDTRSYDVPGLTNGIRYGFKIGALNTAGAGSPSAEASATPQPPIAGAWSYETVLEPATITPGGGVVAQVKFRAKFQADQGSLTSLSARVTSGGALNMGAPPAPMKTSVGSIEEPPPTTVVLSITLTPSRPTLPPARLAP